MHGLGLLLVIYAVYAVCRCIQDEGEKTRNQLEYQERRRRGERGF